MDASEPPRFPAGERPALNVAEIGPVPPSRGLLAKVVGRFVPSLTAGRLTIQLPNGTVIERVGAEPGPDVSMTVHRWRALLRIAFGGDVSFAGAYFDGDWSTADLVPLFQLFMQNEQSWTRATASVSLARLAARWRHRVRSNTRRGSKRNIAEHYDLGNDFYGPWLDAGMSYSSALYAGSETLEEAQENKIDRVADLLELRGSERVLEIGCGWGALAERLIRFHGCRVTGITLSKEQLAFAAARLRREIDAGEVELLLADYRDVDGTYDRIVSIEMFEAVGEEYWSTYFEVIRKRLADGGIAVIQVITIAEDRFAAYRHTPDFIQRYIFPGGMLPTKSLLDEMAKKAGLQITSQRSFGESYARTLAEWRRRFNVAWYSKIQPLGFDERFRRMWDYYLAYCEVGFQTGATDVTLLQIEPRKGLSLESHRTGD